MISEGRVLALCGGVGGAKLALGLDRVLPKGCLTVVANTGDDFEHLGLHISPDLDTVTYTLAGCANPESGWGRADETWNFMACLEKLGGETWFRLGDRDLALHVERTRRLRLGDSLTTITQDLCARLGVRSRVLPMSDDPLRTIVETPDGPLPFQHYFVKFSCQPRVTGIRFEHAETARPQPLVLRALAEPELDAVILCPSNPYLSIDPMLAMPALRCALAACRAPVVAVSPLVRGAAVKGPLAKIMRELGIATTSQAIAAHYGGLLDGIVLDSSDAAEADSLTLPSLTTKTLIRDMADREALARATLAFAQDLGAQSDAPRRKAVR